MRRVISKQSAHDVRLCGIIRCHLYALECSVICVHSRDRFICTSLLSSETRSESRHCRLALNQLRLARHVRRVLMVSTTSAPPP